MSCVVFDLEFNQAAKGEPVISEPFLFHAEIVQIGAVKVDEDFNITDTFDVIVKPSYYTKIGSAVKIKNSIVRIHQKYIFHSSLLYYCKIF